MEIEAEIDKLNPRQREATLHTEGPLLILAGAGSGKTKTLTLRAANLIREGVSPRQVLAVTFTNKAANEMRERIMALAGGERRKIPVISTFHSFCLNHILRQEISKLGYNRDFTIFDTGEQMSLIRNIMGEAEDQERGIKADSILETISRMKNGMTDLDGIRESEGGERSEVIDSVFGRYQESMKTFNVLDFDDILTLTLRLFRDHPEVLDKYRERFRYIMVDEYQDTNKIQYEIVRLLSGEKMNLCVVGDDDQSIYAWRGADIRNILGFEKDFPGARVIRLEQNYRSCGNILEAANSVIRNNRERKEKSLWTDKGDGEKVRIINVKDEEDEAQWVAEKISLIKYYDREKRFDDFAVIYRSNNLSRPFEEAFRRDRIPYTVVGGTSYFDRKEIKDIAAYLMVIANGKDDLSLLRIANTPKRGLGTATLGKVAAYAKERSLPLLDVFGTAEDIPDMSVQTIDTLTAFSEMISRYRKRLSDGKGLKECIEDLMHEVGYRDYIYEFYRTPEVAVKRLGLLDGFLESAARYEQDEESPSLSGFLSAMALTDDEFGKKGKESFGGVTLISLHSAKGLEFPIVFLVGVEEEIIPHKKSIFGSGIEEERRLYYVGITRAMDQLYITHSSGRIKYGKEAPSSPSRFIEEMEAGAVERIDRMKEEDPARAEDKARSFFANIHAMLDSKKAVNH